MLHYYVVVYAIKNTRVTTALLNRHRHGTFDVFAISLLFDLMPPLLYAVPPVHV